MGIFSRLRQPKESPNPFQTPDTLYDLMVSKLEKRSIKDQRIFEHSGKGLSTICVASSIYINAVIRRSFMVYEGVISSIFGVSLLTCVTNYMGLKGAVEWPMMEGKLQCTPCAMIRGAVVQLTTAAISPAIISFTINAMIAEKYRSTFVPDLHFPIRKEFKDFWKRVGPGILLQTKYMIVLQAITGAAIAYKQHEIANELYLSITPDEMRSLWGKMLDHLEF